MAFGLVWVLFCFLAISKNQLHLRWMELSRHCGFSKTCAVILRVVPKEEIPAVLSRKTVLSQTAFHDDCCVVHLHGSNIILFKGEKNQIISSHSSSLCGCYVSLKALNWLCQVLPPFPTPWTGSLPDGVIAED